MAAEGMAGSVEKVRSGGSREVAVTERGTFFGYGDLVVDMRNFARLRDADRRAGHLRRDALGAAAGAWVTRDRAAGEREFIPSLLAAAAAAGADGFFLETHPDPAAR